MNSITRLPQDRSERDTAGDDVVRPRGRHPRHQVTGDDDADQLDDEGKRLERGARRHALDSAAVGVNRLGRSADRSVREASRCCTRCGTEHAAEGSERPARCFQCEANCPVDALFVSPYTEPQFPLDERTLVGHGLLGSYRERMRMGQGTHARVEDRDRSFTTTE